jgi:outer membrane biosynthesis protein TonB
MIELKDQEDGRIALIMDKEELPFAVEALMRAGYELTPPSEDGAEEDEDEDEEPEEPEEPEDQAEEPEEPEDLEDEDEDEEDEDEEEEPEEVEGRGPVRRRGSRARRL